MTIIDFYGLNLLNVYLAMYEWPFPEGGNQPRSMKLSFSISSSKPKSKPSSSTTSTSLRPLDEEPPSSSTSLPQYVTVFDPSQTLTPSSLSSAPLIAPLPNTNQWRAPNRMKNLVPPSQSDEHPSRFVVVSASDPSLPSAPSYGLTIRSSAKDESENEGENKKPPPRARPEAENELRRFRTEIDSLPDDRGIEEFREISVDDFSRAVLAGYGWKEGQGIGRNCKEDVKVVEQRRWSGTSGLGFDPTKEIPTKNSNLGKPDGSDKSRKRGREDERRKSGKVDNAPVHWLRSQIKVRVIAKDLKKGKLYLKKGVVVDVADPVTCDVAMEETRELVQGVDQEMLETALPRCGGPVIVLYGRHKGAFGKLIDKDREKAVAVVRHADSHELFKVRMEQIAEYVGDPADIGY